MYKLLMAFNGQATVYILPLLHPFCIVQLIVDRVILLKPKLEPKKNCK